MAIHKHKLSFDPAASDDYDVVASFLKASDGTLITHTGGALDVNIKTSDISIAVDLDHTNDSVKVGDGTDLLAINTDGSLNARTSGYSTCNNPSAVTVAVTATDLLTTELSGRKEIVIQNTGTKDVYLGCDATVTTAKGLLLPKGATATFKLSDSVDIHAIADGGSSEVRIMELA